MTDNPKYLEQWNRVGRWYERFKEISTGRPDIEHSESYEDEVYAFFLNCYHFKDWIKNDPSSGNMAVVVEDYINQSAALSICADLCNGLKHLTLDKSRNNQQAKFGDRIYKNIEGTVPSTVALGYSIITTYKKYDAIEIAFQCMIDWERFIFKYREPA